jgi:thymidine phosphorylase
MHRRWRKSRNYTAPRSSILYSHKRLGSLERFMPKHSVAHRFIWEGRQTAEDAIAFAVGLSEIKKIGEHVEAQEPLLLVHARTDQALLSVLPLLEQAVEIDENHE